MAVTFTFAFSLASIAIAPTTAAAPPLSPLMPAINCDGLRQ